MGRLIAGVVMLFRYSEGLIRVALSPPSLGNLGGTNGRAGVAPLTTPTSSWLFFLVLRRSEGFTTWPSSRWSMDLPKSCSFRVKVGGALRGGAGGGGGGAAGVETLLLSSSLLAPEKIAFST